MLTLPLIISLILPIIYAAAAAHPRNHRQSISFTFGEEYRLQDDSGLSNTQPVFQVTPPDGGLQPTADSSHATTQTTAVLSARPTTVWRPRDPNAYQHARLRSLRLEEDEAVEWEQIEMLGPDVEDKHTLGQLARMTGNAYALPGEKNWYDLDVAWNTSFPYGWEDAADGFRGHVFVSPENSTVILSIKGTTLQGPTSKKDKFNDNLLFSCCCARVDFSWIFSTVCDCYANKSRCDSTCLSNALVQDSLFYNVGVHMINNITALYPTSTIWLVGHSLGGSLASLLGTTFGLPAVAFEAPGERLAATRLSLPLPPSSLSTHPPPQTHLITSSASGGGYHGSAPVTHVYHNADPIPQGVCTGFGSPCASAGYALETHCHLGKSIVYDTVGKLCWKVDVRNHVIRTVILDVIERDMADGWEEDFDGFLREVPKARVEEDCIDCYKWEFGDFKKKDLVSIL
ncbi:hypothetical protein PHLCEN_2v5887 [Hermanssonia centrifuga]|uniref:triacylglycerol lipase n=1 Tax=Hermanssonia centrifuga TaxID=98765 RepID=A0A2R6P182_9APHY|nr:hypothetical protein PHLCEN_2v5887 [Hermanssonia centrifuga]